MLATNRPSTRIRGARLTLLMFTALALVVVLRPSSAQAALPTGGFR